MLRSAGRLLKRSSIPSSSADLLIWFPCAPSLKWRIGLTVKMNCLPLHPLVVLQSSMILCRADVTSAEESLSRLNSDALCFKQLDTMNPFSMCLKHQLVPSVMITLPAAMKCSLAVSRARLALRRNSSLEAAAKLVWWQNEHQRLSPAPIWTQSSSSKGVPLTSFSILRSMDTGLYNVPNGLTHTSNP